MHPLISLLPDDKIGVDGAVALSEMLKTNTTLITIVLDSLNRVFVFEDSPVTNCGTQTMGLVMKVQRHFVTH